MWCDGKWWDTMQTRASLRYVANGCITSYTDNCTVNSSELLDIFSAHHRSGTYFFLQQKNLFISSEGYCTARRRRRRKGVEEKHLAKCFVIILIHFLFNNWILMVKPTSNKDTTTTTRSGWWANELRCTIARQQEWIFFICFTMIWWHVVHVG